MILGPFTAKRQSTETPLLSRKGTEYEDFHRVSATTHCVLPCDVWTGQNPESPDIIGSERFQESGKLIVSVAGQRFDL